MKQFDIAQLFIERCERATPLEELTTAFEGGLQSMGFRHFACCSHVDPLRPPRSAVMLHNYPAGWVRTYSDLKLQDSDPVFLCADRTFLPFSWDAPAFRARLTAPQKKILMEAEMFDLAHGYTMPIHLPSLPGAPRASCSVVPDSGSVDPRSYYAMQLMATYLYAAASRELDSRNDSRPQNVLTRRQRQCLELAAQGKSDWVISRLLGLSESTVHNHIESAKRRLGVATRVQAIVEALASRQISFGDAVRGEAMEKSRVLSMSKRAVSPPRRSNGGDTTSRR